MRCVLFSDRSHNLREDYSPFYIGHFTAESADCQQDEWPTARFTVANFKLGNELLADIVDICRRLVRVALK